MSSIIPITEIHGVDVEAGTVASHPMLPNPKLELRREVIENLKTDLKNGTVYPVNIAPIELWQVADDELAVVDGLHRLTAFVELANEEPKKEDWQNIRYVMRQENADSARFAQVRAALEESRTHLTPHEEFELATNLLKQYTEDQIAKMLGSTGKRFINRCKHILSAGPALKDAVVNEGVSPKVAEKIAKNIPPKDQPKAIEKAVEEVKRGSDTKQTETALGFAPRKAVWSFDKCMTYLKTEFIPSVTKPSQLDDYAQGQLDMLQTVMHIEQLDWKSLVQCVEDYFKGK